jgi:hypothetical protein
MHDPAAMREARSRKWRALVLPAICTLFASGLLSARSLHAFRTAPPERGRRLRHSLSAECFIEQELMQ